MDRRAFCVFSASGALAVAALGAPRAAHRGPGVTPRPFDHVVIDSRFRESLIVGDAAARLGAAVAAFPGDLTQVWLKHLKPHWTIVGTPVAGLTTPAGLFCLERLAADHWLRVVARLRVGAAPERGRRAWSDGLLSSLARRTPVEPDRPMRLAPPAGDALVAWVIARS